MKSDEKKLNPPDDIRQWNLCCEFDPTAFTEESFYIECDEEWIGLDRAKELHQWLGDAFAYIEQQEKRGK